MKPLRFLAFATIGLLAAPLAYADIFQTVGPDGVVSFSNTPSRGSKKVVKETAVAMPRDRSPERLTRYDAHIREAATLYQIPEALVRAVIKVESNYDPRAVSPAGAHGLMQLMPFTAEAMMVQDIFDPRQNILGGTRYLRVLANLFNGDIHLTIAGYNAGENAVIRYGGIPPYKETQNYVVEVLRYYQEFRAEEQRKKVAAAP
ncbi:MAG TPA: lytic transglycosylase domain-containing protein [Polyangiaceae bacterium]|nr:lytic transglycosylase domain-containing protein [Polyangiaceae bacterium]